MWLCSRGVLRGMVLAAALVLLFVNGPSKIFCGAGVPLTSWSMSSWKSSSPDRAKPGSALVWTMKKLPWAEGGSGSVSGIIAEDLPLILQSEGRGARE